LVTFQIMSKLLARNADLMIAEIDQTSVRIGGDNSLYISEVDWFAERAPDAALIPLTPPRVLEEEQRVVEAICGAVARELIPDRARSRSAYDRLRVR
jgi:hypothetical protein